MKPYYEYNGITIYHGDCREVLPVACDIVLTDPPYGEETHSGARSLGKSDDLRGHNPIDFSSVSVEFLREIFGLCKPLRWLVSFIEWRYCLPLEEKPPEGLEFIRFGIWTKLNPMPQLTGDRPGTGWEAVAILHPPGNKKWNGGGSPALWMHGTSRFGYFGPSNHPTEKPLGLVSRLVEQFSDCGETILDPFMGSGTMLVAAQNEGRCAIGIEKEEKYCEIAAKRLSQENLFGSAPKDKGSRETAYNKPQPKMAEQMNLLESATSGDRSGDK